MFRSIGSKKGFSIVEMMVVVAVMVILVSLLLINYSSIKQQLALRRGASQFSQDIRAAQGLALGTTEHDCDQGGETKASGFGICVGDECFENSGLCADNCTYIYTVFANCFKNPSQGGGVDHQYDFEATPSEGGSNKDDILKTINLETGLKICQRYDANCDGKIVTGLVPDSDAVYIRNFLNRTDCVAPDWCQGADVNRDGKVSATDLALNNKADQSTVVFEFPGPTTHFGGVLPYTSLDDGDTLQDFRIIVNNDPTKARNVSINSAGLIEIK